MVFLFKITVKLCLGHSAPQSMILRLIRIEKLHKYFSLLVYGEHLVYFHNFSRWQKHTRSPFYLYIHCVLLLLISWKDVTMHSFVKPLYFVWKYCIDIFGAQKVMLWRAFLFFDETNHHHHHHHCTWLTKQSYTVGMRSVKKWVFILRS